MNKKFKKKLLQTKIIDQGINLWLEDRKIFNCPTINKTTFKKTFVINFIPFTV